MSIKLENFDERFKEVSRTLEAVILPVHFVPVTDSTSFPLTKPPFSSLPSGTSQMPICAWINRSRQREVRMGGGG